MNDWRGWAITYYRKRHLYYAVMVDFDIVYGRSLRVLKVRIKESD